MSIKMHKCFELDFRQEAQSSSFEDRFDPMCPSLFAGADTSLFRTPSHSFQGASGFSQGLSMHCALTAMHGPGMSFPQPGMQTNIFEQGGSGSLLHLPSLSQMELPRPGVLNTNGSPLVVLPDPSFPSFHGNLPDPSFPSFHGNLPDPSFHGVGSIYS